MATERSPIEPIRTPNKLRFLDDQQLGNLREATLYILENTDTGNMAVLDMVCFAAPCDEFSQFAAQSQQERLPAPDLKETLQFLNNGRRGFLLVLREGQEAATVHSGDRVYVVRST
ncbi:hypothetical protein ACFLYP_00605 [Chloroflexota bacterium]